MTAQATGVFWNMSGEGLLDGARALRFFGKLRTALEKWREVLPPALQAQAGRPTRPDPEAWGSLQVEFPGQDPGAR